MGLLIDGAKFEDGIVGLMVSVEGSVCSAKPLEVISTTFASWDSAIGAWA